MTRILKSVQETKPQTLAFNLTSLDNITFGWVQSVLRKIPELQELCMEDNQLSSLVVDNKQLRVLNLSRNPLTALSFN